jgi:hypothetical protein
VLDLVNPAGVARLFRFTREASLKSNGAPDATPQLAYTTAMRRMLKPPVAPGDPAPPVCLAHCNCGAKETCDIEIVTFARFAGLGIWGVTHLEPIPVM